MDHCHSEISYSTQSHAWKKSGNDASVLKCIKKHLLMKTLKEIFTVNKSNTSLGNYLNSIW